MTNLSWKSHRAVIQVMYDGEKRRSKIQVMYDGEKRRGKIQVMYDGEKGDTGYGKKKNCSLVWWSFQ